MSDKPLLIVLFDGRPAASVVRLDDGTILAEVPRPIETPDWRVVDSWIEATTKPPAEGAS
jgi:hypothetical protein